MAHKTLIGGTAYEIDGGKTLIGGTSYEIDKGKTLVGGTAYEVGFDSKEKHVTASSEILDTWAVISACTYRHYYSLGNWKTFTTTNGITVKMEIVAFDSDFCTDTGANAPITWLAKGIYWTGQHNSSTTQSYGWVNSLIRARLESGGNIYNSIPSEVMNVIKTVRKYDMYYPGNTAFVNTRESKLWIPNYREIYGGTSWEHIGADYTSYFSSFNKRIKYDTAANKKNWWLRTVHTGNSNFWYVKTNGYGDGATPNNNYGVVIGFCT